MSVLRSFAALLLVLFGAFAAPCICRAQLLDQKVREPGLFTYQAPKGWELKTTPMSKYQVAMAAPNNNFSANINVVMESNPKSLADYVEVNKAFLKASPLFLNLKVVDQKPFETTVGLKGIRVLVDDTLGKLDLQQIFYFFDGAGDNKFVVTATSLVGDGDHYAPFFDASLKTFSIP